jgi:antitoxin component of MazEF toxin-antitoxin module
MKQFTITKRIAKHGNQAIIVIPRLLEDQLKPGTVVKLEMEILEN